MKNKNSIPYAIWDLLPLLIIFLIIGSATIMHQLYYGVDVYTAMRIFMGVFFLVFGFFKLINIDNFVQAYSMYDVVAKRYRWYGYIYPLIELALAAAYLLSWKLRLTNFLTLIVMLVSALGVFLELQKGKAIVCACLGTVFKVPMTYVTLIEDLLMAAMALIMLFR